MYVWFRVEICSEISYMETTLIEAANETRGRDNKWARRVKMREDAKNLTKGCKGHKRKVTKVV